MIELVGVHKAFGRGVRRRVALDGLDLRAGDGQITALLGPNGAGKTTALRIVAGLLPADAGTARVDGVDAAADPAAVRARLGVLGDARGLYPRLTARENVVYHARLHGMTGAAADARLRALAGPLEMGPLLDRRTEGFSQGERMKTALARALVHDPHNLVLDEPTNGLDVPSTRALRELLRRLRDGAARPCIVVCTHLMAEVERLADHVVVIADGRSVACGSVDALRRAGGAADLEDAFVALSASGRARTA